MTGPELKALLAPMSTPRWQHDPRSEVIEDRDGTAVCAMFCQNSPANAAAICALANHGPMLVELMRAVEEYIGDIDCDHLSTPDTYGMRDVLRRLWAVQR